MISQVTVGVDGTTIREQLLSGFSYRRNPSSDLVTQCVLSVRKMLALGRPCSRCVTMALMNLSDLEALRIICRNSSSGWSTEAPRRSSSALLALIECSAEGPGRLK
jgi:hypothetical protein